MISTIRVYCSNYLINKEDVAHIIFKGFCIKKKEKGKEKGNEKERRKI